MHTYMFLAYAFWLLTPLFLTSKHSLPPYTVASEFFLFILIQIYVFVRKSLSQAPPAAHGIIILFNWRSWIIVICTNKSVFRKQSMNLPCMSAPQQYNIKRIRTFMLTLRRILRMWDTYLWSKQSKILKNFLIF